MKEDVLEVEAPLIEGQMNEIDKQLQKAVTEINWTTEGVMFLFVFYTHAIFFFL